MAEGADGAGLARMGPRFRYVSKPSGRIGPDRRSSPLGGRLHRGSCTSGPPFPPRGNMMGTRIALPLGSVAIRLSEGQGSPKRAE